MLRPYLSIVRLLEEVFMRKTEAVYFNYRRVKINGLFQMTNDNMGLSFVLEQIKQLTSSTDHQKSV